MKKSLGCQDLGVTSCSFEARSENSAEIKEAIFVHAQKYHPEKVADLSEPQIADLDSMMESIMEQTINYGNDGKRQRRNYHERDN